MTKHTAIKTAITTNDEIKQWPLTDTYVSEHNPRAAEPIEDADVEDLAKTMVASGLIQNLSGLLDKNGKVGIVAGRRRWYALQLAVKERPELALVDIRITSNLETALSWAMLENTQRVDMDKVDEIRAYKDSQSSGLSVSQIAKAYCVTEAKVYKRLSLANLPAPVLDALKANEISIDDAKAFTKSDDEDLILQVLEQVKDHSWWGAHQITSSLTEAKVDADCRQMRFVGLEAYKKAGGKLDTNLFDDDATVDDTDILDRLFEEKLVEEATKIQVLERLAWVETYEGGYTQASELMTEYGFARLSKIKTTFTDEQQTRYDELDEEPWWQLNEEDRVEKDALEEIREGDYSDEQRALSGAAIFVNQQGQISTVVGLVNADHLELAIEAGFIKEASEDDHQTSEAEVIKSPYSAKFTDDMTAIRLAAVQTALLEKPELVLDLLAFGLSQGSDYGNNIMAVGFQNHRNKPEADDETFILDKRLGGLLTDEEEAELDDIEEKSFDSEWERFAAFREAGKKSRNAGITGKFARSLKTQGNEFMAMIEGEVGADIRTIWTPNAVNCFKRLKGWQLDAEFMSLLDLGPDNPSYLKFSKLKKGQKNTEMELLFSDPEKQKLHKVTAEQKKRIGAWVPNCFN